MQGIGERLHLVKTHANEIGQPLFVHAPKKLLKVEGLKFQRLFLGWDDDIFNVLLDAEQGSSFDVVVTSVCNEILDESACLRVHLDLVKDDKRLMFIEFDVIENREIEEERVEVSAIVLKILLNFGRCLKEINDKAGLVFGFSKRAGKRALSDAAGSFNKKCCFTSAFMLPF